MSEIKAAPSKQMQALREAYLKVDAYQPVYKFESEFQSRPVSRTCLDRCELLYNEFGADAMNLRILDVGCSMGYLTFYFADKGSDVTGMDLHEPNLVFCRALSDATGIRASFVRGDFSLDFTSSLQHGRFDVVFLFSVLHHVINRFGVDETKRMMAHLLEKADVLYVELARKSEDVAFDWKGRLPEDELEIFDGIPNVEINLLGEFPALGATAIRPLYRVRKTTRKIGRIEQSGVTVQRSKIRDGRTKDRKYYVSEQIFTKTFIFSSKNIEVYNKFCREIFVYERVGADPHFLPLLGVGMEGDCGSLIFPRISGDPLSIELPHRHFPLRKTALSALSILVTLAKAGLFWNDFRTHNLAFYGDTLIGFDFETANAVELENTRTLFLWLLFELQSRAPQAIKHKIFQQNLRDIPPPPLSLEEYAAEIREIAAAAVQAPDTRSFLRGAARFLVET